MTQSDHATQSDHDTESDHHIKSDHETSQVMTQIQSLAFKIFGVFFFSFLFYNKLDVVNI